MADDDERKLDYDERDTRSVQSPFNSALAHLETLCSLQRRLTDVRIYDTTNVDLWRSLLDSIYSTLRGGWLLSAKETEIHDNYFKQFGKLREMHPKKECNRYLGNKKWAEVCNHNFVWQRLCHEYELELMDACRRLGIFMPGAKNPGVAVKE